MTFSLEKLYLDILEEELSNSVFAGRLIEQNPILYTLLFYLFAKL